MARLIGLLAFLAIVAGIVLIVRWAMNSDARAGVRRKDLKEAKRELLKAETLITAVEAAALSNIDFQPHLAGAVLTQINEYRRDKQQALKA